MKRIYIVNPTSGHGRSLKVAKEIHHICLGKKLDFEIIETKGPSDATMIAKEFDKENHVIFSVGGDGTLHEIVNGMHTASISIIPSGTGNDFYKTITEQTDKIDLGIVNERYFVNIAALGIDALIALKGNQLKEKGFDKFSYPLGIISALKEYQAFDTTLGQFWALAICNGQSYGGGFQIAPFADNQDGYLDLCMIKNIPFLKLLKVFLKIVQSTHAHDSNFQHYQIKEVTVNSSDSIICNVDGEIMESCEYRFGIHKSALQYYHERDLDLQKLIKKKN